MSLYQELKRRNVLRVAIAYLAGSWLLVEVAETIFPLFGFDDTPARILVIVLAIGFPLFLLFSWVFEITPEGLKKEKDIDRTASVTHKTGKQLYRIIIVLLALALGYFAFDKFVLDPVEDDQIAESAHQEGRSEALTESFGDKSIAVLPFVNMSDDAGNEYFSDGISEELLNLLSKIPELRVISRSSAFSFKDKDFDIPTIAKQLNVAHILEGSVRKDGNQVRITAQLIDARSDTHLWSETYDRELEHIFIVQDEISAAITKALTQRLGLEVEDAPRTAVATNTEAHDAYLRGRYLVSQRTPTTIDGAAREFEKAIALEPDYALAHAELAMAIVLLWSENYGNLSRNEVFARATVHTRRSMALDPKLAEAHAAAGFLAKVGSAYEEALSHYENAIEINPNYSIVHSWKADALARVGRYKEEVVARESGLQLDPLSRVNQNNYVFDLILRNRLDEASLEMEKFASIAPAWAADMQGKLASVGGKWANTVLGGLEAMQLNYKSLDLPDEFAIIGLEREALTISDTIEPFPYHILGRTRDAVGLAEVPLAGGGIRSLWERRELGLALAAVGDYVGAQPLLEEMWLRRKGVVVQEGLFEVNHAAALMAIRRNAGEDAGVGELLEAIGDNVLRCREAGLTGTYWRFNVDYEEGLATFLSGERELGLALITRAVDDGYFILPNEAYLQTLYDDPGFAPIRVAQEARQARERNRFLAIVCADNPYAAVWQPAEGTCERFAAESGN